MTKEANLPPALEEPYLQPIFETLNQPMQDLVRLDLFRYGTAYLLRGGVTDGCPSQYTHLDPPYVNPIFDPDEGEGKGLLLGFYVETSEDIIRYRAEDIVWFH